MKNLSKDLQQELADQYDISYGEVKLDKLSDDQTRKFLIGFNTQQDPRAIVETVIIPEQRRSTLCVSSQIGCSLKCKFCHTGTQQLERNLTSGEIVGQYMIAAHTTHDFESSNNKKTISNMVFMGQGEPLYNWRQLQKAIHILTHEQGLHLTKSKVTVSTSGVAPLIPKLASDLGGVSLAISLHATNNSLRDILVPLNKTYSLETVLEACRTYAAHMGIKRGRGKRITFEYVMLDKTVQSMAWKWIQVNRNASY
ncbi:cfr family radical SAM enzyme [Mycotypha africana]|uniref:cfr family radical SAM enzyme n=1 Tax=Mycotypha africana TaxID=64632 RepID=UPI0023016658|nr:cfr family radical SAM enzyme [Mycotypha africana]KAI8971812.1 cfr family radical SAM enzyme [Mycotypha africana]